MDLHGADIEKHKADVASITGERDAEKTRADNLAKSVESRLLFR
jgi:hypothetical protein